MTVVTPCRGDGVSAESQKTCASKCVCTSMNPGVMTLPVASTVCAASSVIVPMATMRPSFTPTSARRRGEPVPSTTVPPVSSRSSMATSAHSPWLWLPEASTRLGHRDDCPMNLVLVHGSGFDSSCWDPVLPHLKTEAAVVDLPGRGRRPGDLAAVGLDDFAAAVAEDIKATGWERVVLVGHSLAGLTIPRVAKLIPEAIGRLVFVSSNVPPHGNSCFDTLDPAVSDGVRANIAANGGVSPALTREMAVGLYGNDLDAEQTEWMLAHSLPEAGRVYEEPCDLSGL